jgi:succinate dehydrogenase/fumarate reductase-like Fe-S protein
MQLKEKDPSLSFVAPAVKGCGSDGLNMNGKTVWRASRRSPR